MATETETETETETATTSQLPSKEELRAALYKLADIQADALYDAMQEVNTKVPAEQVPAAMTDIMNTVTLAMQQTVGAQVSALKKEVTKFKETKHEQ